MYNEKNSYSVHGLPVLPDNIIWIWTIGKNAVVIEKKNNRFGSKPSFSKNTHQRNTFNKPKTNFVPKKPFMV